jgi:quinol monooxygenase YgiN
MVLAVCQRHGWTLGQWHALSDDEQETWLAYEVWRNQELARIHVRFDGQLTVESAMPLLMARLR